MPDSEVQTPGLSEPLPPCSVCGYDLSGSTTGICPECGRPVYCFTERAREVVRLANDQAIWLLLDRAYRWWMPRGRLPTSCIEPGHLLLAICTGPYGVGQFALHHCGVKPLQLHNYLVKRMPRGALSRTHEISQRLMASDLSQAVTSEAVEQAFALDHKHVGTEHLLLALCKRGDRYTRQAMRKFNLTHEQIKSVILANAEANKRADQPT